MPFSFGKYGIYVQYHGHIIKIIKYKILIEKNLQNLLYE